MVIIGEFGMDKMHYNSNLKFSVTLFYQEKHVQLSQKQGKDLNEKMNMHQPKII